MNKLGLQLQKAAEDLKTDTNNPKKMMSKILRHKKLVTRFWNKVSKIQDGEEFQDEFSGDHEDYAAWMYAADLDSEDEAEDFLHDFVSGDDKIEAVYKKYGISEAT